MSMNRSQITFKVNIYKLKLLIAALDGSTPDCSPHAMLARDQLVIALKKKYLEVVERT